MKHVLCFGDSNTWGFIPGTCKRYDEHTLSLIHISEPTRRS